MFVLGTIVVFVVVFPPASLIVLCLAVFTIPLVYFYLVVPAIVAGGVFAAVMIVFRSRIPLGGSKAFLVGMLIGGASNCAWIASFGIVGTLSNILFRDINTAADAALKLVLMAIMATQVPSLIVAGGVCALLIRGEQFQAWMAEEHRRVQ